MVLKMLCMYMVTNAQKEQQFTQNKKQNDLYQGIENAVYISCQKFPKEAETCPNFKQ